VRGRGDGVRHTSSWCKDGDDEDDKDGEDVEDAEDDEDADEISTLNICFPAHDGGLVKWGYLCAG
jgi:hypothetical protein